MLDFLPVEPDTIYGFVFLGLMVFVFWAGRSSAEAARNNPDLKTGEMFARFDMFEAYLMALLCLFFALYLFFR